MFLYILFPVLSYYPILWHLILDFIYCKSLTFSNYSFQIRDHFVPSVEPTYFMQYCCHWLLPALLLHGDTSNLKWVASVGDFSFLFPFLFFIRHGKPLNFVLDLNFFSNSLLLWNMTFVIGWNCLPLFNKEIGSCIVFTHVSCTRKLFAIVSHLHFSFVILDVALILFQVAGLPLAVLVKNHFVPIFSVCMALHCSKKSGWEKGAVVLQSSILHVAEISEDERDKLIKKYMVCSFYFSFWFSAPYLIGWLWCRVKNCLAAAVFPFLYCKKLTIGEIQSKHCKLFNEKCISFIRFIIRVQSGLFRLISPPSFGFPETNS